MKQSNSEGIAIIGMSGRFPGAANVDEFWSNLVAGKESISTFSDEELAASGLDVAVLRKDPNYVAARGILRDAELFDAAFFDINAKQAEIIDPQQRLFLEASWSALEHAGYDPERYEGAIGVFAGMANETYYLNNLHSRRDLVESMGERIINLGNAKDFLAARVAYKLNLRGPALSINTACSTGLVAVCQACQSLLSYQCDLALGGGVAVSFPQRRGVRYQENGIFSPDGHCRPLDVNAQGTVSSEGLGIVVLKRLDEALDDGDNIIAVIKGFGLNNDGSKKVGFTAPSVDGQADAIAIAQADAGFDPSTISYVECHGTATPIGDPIEIAALTQAFRLQTSQKNFCAIGSVKSNIGHADTAAGVAGLIKTALALKHKTIPASLHFEKPNPKIDFADSPFFVNTKLTEWKAGSTPRRAGVSSFGIGGTNAHVVLEEAPAQQPSSSSRPWQLLLLSAKTARALETASANLLAYFKANPDLNLADAAFTLQAGRGDFQHRRMLVCRDLEDAVKTLESADAKRIVSQQAITKGRPVVFMFSGQGAQYVNMGVELYQAEPVFKEEVDRCAKILMPHLGLDLRQILFPPAGQEAAAEELLLQTRITQPALFVFEYALAKLWNFLGMAPAAMAGHSLGTIVAACLSGVFTLEDALAFVVRRAQLVQNQPKGAMLAVRLPEKETQPLLTSELSIAAINAPSLCVVSGPFEAIEGLEARLKEQGVAARRLHTSHAFHSAMMEPVLEPLAEFLAKIKFSKPAIPFISDVTGCWITEQEATDPKYWVKHVRQAVRFADGVGELFKNPEYILLEVGPGQTLSPLANQHPGKGAAHLVLASLSASKEQEMAALLNALGRLWLAGQPIDWTHFYRDEKRRRIPLPTYAFQRERYWVESKRTEGIMPSTLPLVIAETKSDQVTGHERPTLGTMFKAPTNDLERTLTNIWQKLLGFQGVGVDDNFFDLGGDSLLLMQLQSKIRQELGTSLSLAEMHQNPAISSLAKCLGRSDAAAAGLGEDSDSQLQPSGREMSALLVPKPEERYEPFPLTDIQQAYWIGRGSDFEMGNVGTHVYRELEVEGLNLVRYEQAWQRLIERHDMLRAIVLPDGLQQILKTPFPFKIKVQDLSGESPESAQKILAAIRREMSHQILPCDRSPLVEIRAFKLGKNLYRLCASSDMLVMDAWSLQIIPREVSELYANPDQSLPALNLSFRDYVLTLEKFRKSVTYQRSLAYWNDRLETLPSHPEIPLAKSPEAIKSPRFSRRQHSLEPELWETLKSKAASSGLTLNVLILAVFADVLATWGKRPRFTINLTLFNRFPIHPQVNELIGDFTSTTLLTAELSSQETFVEFAKKLMSQLWKDLDHRYVSGVEVLRMSGRKKKDRASTTAPVNFTSVLGFNNREMRPTFGGVPAKLIYRVTQTPQIWLDQIVFIEDGKLLLNWDVVDELFPEGMIDDMFEVYVSQLRHLATDESAWAESRWNRMMRLVPSRQLQQRKAINDTAKPVAGALLHQLFENQAQKTPQQMAVIGEDVKLTYSELMHMSRKLGRKLRKMGAKPNALVAIVMEKGWEQVVAALSILQSGAAYVPIDASQPQERLFQLLKNAEVKIAVTRPSLDESLSWPSDIKRLCIDKTTEKYDADGPLDPLQTPGDLAYVIYTSGSTGLPKGVMIDHRGAVNTILDMNERFGVSPRDKVLALSSMSFDLSVYDVFGMLAAGGTMVIPEAAASRDPARWAELTQRESVTIWNSVPALMEMFVEYVSGCTEKLTPSLRLVLLSGDWIPLTLPDQIRAISNKIQLISLGGATEASIWSILYPIENVDPAWKSIPYGRPMVNQSFHVLNDLLEPCPVWVPGQLYIGGIGLAVGYWRDAEKTAAKFIIHPKTGERLYHTGDLGRYLPSGDIEFLGREDFQVKIRGFRIELGEIEAAFSSHPDVRSVVVTAIGKTTFERSLAAYVVLDREEKTDPSAGNSTIGTATSRSGFEARLKEFLAAKLPEHMIPSIIIVLDALPLTPNGKVDHRSLPKPERVEVTRQEEGTMPRTEVEKELAGIFREVLKVDTVGIHDDFFELGGDSVTAIQLVSRANKKGYQLLPVMVFRHSTIAAIAGLCKQPDAAAVGKANTISELLEQVEQLSEEELKKLASQ